MPPWWPRYDEGDLIKYGGETGIVEHVYEPREEIGNMYEVRLASREFPIIVGEPSLRPLLP
jgi:hypothetical protein